MYSGIHFGDISQRVGVYAVAKMLAMANSQLVLEKFAKVTTVPKNKSLTIKFRRPITFPVSPSPLQEGVTPAPQGFGFEDVVVTLQQYGAWSGITDVLKDTHEDPVLQEISSANGKQAADTKEMILWGVIRAGTQKIYTGVATQRSDVQAVMDLGDIRAAIRELKTNHAMFRTSAIRASTAVSTEPVSAAYIGVGHTNLESDFREMAGFLPAEQYGSGGVIHPLEIGKVEAVRIILTPHLVPFLASGSTTTTGVLNSGGRVDVYPFVIFGEDAFASTKLAGADSVEMAVKNPKMGESYTDPLGQRGFVSWKMWYAAVRLNEQWMIRIEAAVSQV